MTLPSAQPDTRKRYIISYEAELNASQLEAVTFTDGPLLVIAGAGSGKTRTLTYRVARLMEEGIPPHAILLLTFTRKAAQEMLKRASGILDSRCERVSGGTFHSFANSVLRRYAAAIGVEAGFTIMDRADSESLIGILRDEMGVGKTNRAFPRKQTLGDIFSKAANKSLTVEEVVQEEYPHFEEMLKEIVKLSAHYARRKIEHHFFDYDDLLLRLKQMLEEKADIRERISETYRFIMVDEYQDTNLVQAEIVSLLSSVHKNIMVVGDDSQSIYAFRGANFKNIMQFPRMFSGARIIRLEENYRSVQPILDLTNTIIERAREKYSKHLFTRRTGGEPPALVKTYSENIQSRFVVEKIQELHRKGTPYHEMAVLFRAGYHSFDLEIELNREGIAYVKFGGFKFMESAHIKDVLAHLRILSNPYDRISWYRVLLLLDKIGPRTAGRIYEAVAEKKAGYAGFLSVEKDAKSSEGIGRLKDLIAGMDPAAMSVARMGEAVLDYYTPILKSHYDDHPRRARDLEQLVALMGRYRSLEQFLTDMALEPPNASTGEALSVDDPGEQEEDRLILSTVHSAKGLEWHAVFILWALDGRFPSIHAWHDPDDLEEERRLMYVAATRAKEHLFIIYPMQTFDRSTGTVLTQPSRFLDGISDKVLRKHYIHYY